MELYASLLGDQYRLCYADDQIMLAVVTSKLKAV